MATDEEVKPKVSGYKLFMKAYYKQKKKKNEEMVPLGQEAQSVKQAWNALREDEKERYRKRAQKLSMRQGKKYVVPFMTRCAPNQFMKLCQLIKDKPDMMERLEKIGFHKLVDICCAQIPRHLCGRFMDSFDPPTKNVSIRGKSLHVGPEDVRQIMGLPCHGRKIETNTNNQDKSFKELKRMYGSIPYKTIGNWLVERKKGMDFETLFVIYALGTLLCPSAAIKVSDTVLKVIVATKAAFTEYDWCTFILDELCNSIGVYKKKLRKGTVTAPLNIGGCMYFLMIYCLQHFPLGPVQAPTVEDAIIFWDDNRVKTRVQTERESNKGLLLPYGDGVGQSSTQLQPEPIFSHPEIKRTYDRVMSRVRSILQEELGSLQARLLGGREIDEDDGNDEGEGQREGESEDEEDGGDTEQEDGGDTEEEDGGDTEKEDDDMRSTKDDEGYKSEGGSSQKGQECDDTNYSNEDQVNVEEEFHNLRKSERLKKPAIGSPWVVTNIGKKRAKVADEKEALYQFCTATCTKEEEMEEFVQMHDYFLTRKELHCLRENAWINNRIMSMVAKTLVGDELQRAGHVKRHIFSAELMEKMSDNPQRWSWEAHEKEILPEHIGYNIGECDFIFGPTLHLNHWFCYVLDTKTMRFYALDSYVDSITYLRLQNEAEEAMKGCAQTKKPKRMTKTQQQQFNQKEWMASRCRECFLKIIQKVKPTLFGKGREIPDQVNWAKVHLQSDTNSCGVHVLSWLQGWDGSPKDNEGYTITKLSPDQLRLIKVECLWWLVTHDQNIHKQKVLSQLSENQQPKKKK
ncbi:hypothetical protein QN277_013007 [Acacia crassicarpa]|uniref:Ubiquitin-like protease family profile domain-containing protein n=1 Tax=Acacia crassicarpa TaxID=499986 RepID=A0AAE1N2C3_9FABA|nr:hypothetical protein QN277_013007 [Acacia crassicarpa]